MIQIRVSDRGAAMLPGLSRFIQSLMQDGFYGTVEIQFVEGEIVVVRKQETFKPAAFLLVE